VAGTAGVRACSSRSVPLASISINYWPVGTSCAQPLVRASRRFPELPGASRRTASKDMTSYMIATVEQQELPFAPGSVSASSLLHDVILVATFGDQGLSPARAWLIPVASFDSNRVFPRSSLNADPDPDTRILQAVRAGGIAAMTDLLASAGKRLLDWQTAQLQCALLAPVRKRK
jgi:hypothetical protein